MLKNVKMKMGRTHLAQYICGCRWRHELFEFEEQCAQLHAILKTSIAYPSLTLRLFLNWSQFYLVMQLQNVVHIMTTTWMSCINRIYVLHLDSYCGACAQAAFTSRLNGSHSRRYTSLGVESMLFSCYEVACLEIFLLLPPESTISLIKTVC